MATEAVPVKQAWFSRPSVRFVARAALAVFAMWTLYRARLTYEEFVMGAMRPFNGLPWGLWFRSIAIAVGAGLLFALAASFPFARVRYQWGRLLLAALAMLPLLQFRMLYTGNHPGWFATGFTWFSGPSMHLTLAVLAGVAIASGFRAVEGDAEAPSEASPDSA